MATLSLIGVKLFGDREIQESLDKEGISLWVFAIGVDITTGNLLWRVL